MNWRPEIADTIPHDPPEDLLGRKQPRRLGILGILRSMPLLWRAFSVIPDMAWSLDTNDDGYSAAVVTCPCGRTPVVEIGMMEHCDERYAEAVIADEEPPEDACPRSYLFAGKAVYVAGSPHRPISDP